MRRTEEMPLDPEVTAVLDAIDATLAGEPVDPRHAELAELALLLAAERPETGAPFTARLDESVEQRFAPGNAQTGPRAAARRWSLWTPAAGLAVAIVIAIGVVLSSAPATPRSGATSARAPVAHSGLAAPTAPQRAASAPPALNRALAAGSVGPSVSSSSSQASAAANASVAANAQTSPTLQPPPNGRRITQGAQLSLTTAPSRIDTVAQEVFTVVGQNNGIVKSSTVTATGGPGAYALFQLSIPSAGLAQTMTSLSGLRYAHVASRTDTSQDVNDQYQAAVRRLADARALRTSLLKQLANAITQSQIQSLTAQIHDAEASISSDEAALRTLNAQINYSQVTVNVNGGVVPVPVHGSGGGFSLGRAAHDAGRVLTVTAGVALIAAAVLLPLALLVALGWWVGTAFRRRRREHALDLV